MKNEALAEKMQQAELENTHAETAKVKADTDKVGVDINKTLAEFDIRVAKATAEIDKITAEAAILRKQNTWYPLVVTAGVASGATLAIVVVVKLFL